MSELAPSVDARRNLSNQAPKRFECCVKLARKHTGASTYAFWESFKGAAGSVSPPRAEPQRSGLGPMATGVYQRLREALPVRDGSESRVVRRRLACTSNQYDSRSPDEVRPSLRADQGEGGYIVQPRANRARLANRAGRHAPHRRTKAIRTAGQEGCLR